MAAAITLFEQRNVLLKGEGTYGSDAAPTGAANAVFSLEASLQLEASKLDRKQDRAFFGAYPYVLVGKQAIVEFEIDLIGASGLGTAAPCAAVLLAMAHAQVLVATTSATYNPVSSAFGSATIYFNWAGVLFEIVGARGSMEIDLTAKAFGRAKCRFLGLIDTGTPTQAAAPALTLTAWQAPPAVETETFSLTIGGVAVNATSFKLNQGMDTKLLEGSEFREVFYAQRASTGSITMTAEALATYNPWADANAHTNRAIVATVNGGAGKITTVNAPTAQFEYPRKISLDGAMGWEIPFTAKPNAGNDEYSVVFT